ncbi:MAG: hypothetical protein ACREPI_11465 [Candidatus Dormibacterales bacterium]
MIGRGSAAGAGRTVRLTLVACALAATVSAAAGLATGRATGGIALGVGLLIGSANGLLVSRTIGEGAPVVVSSLGRLAVLSAAGLAAGLVIGPDVGWLVLLGLAGAQLLLGLVAGSETLRQAR